MKRSSVAALFFGVTVLLGSGVAPAQPILFAFTGLRGSAAETCKWFDDNLADRSIGALTRQTDMLFNRIALPAGENVSVLGSAVTDQQEQLVDFDLHSARICTAAAAIYGPTPTPAAETPMPAPS